MSRQDQSKTEYEMPHPDELETVPYEDEYCPVCGEKVREVDDE